MNKIKRFFKNLFYGLFYGMKGSEDVILNDKGINNGADTGIVKEIKDKSVIKALLRGEVTEEVEDLRYRTYKVDQESKLYEYFAPTLALKRDDKQDRKDMKYDDSDGLELITIQPNKALTETIIEGLEQLGGMILFPEYRIKIKRSFTPRYKIEQYITRLDVKRFDKTHVILDAYVSKYTKNNDFKSKGFISEIKRIMNEKVKSDILIYEEISFTTSHAYKLPDLVTFRFRNIIFKEIKEFDGHYIVRFKASFETSRNDLTKTYYSKRMDLKYKNKEKKDVVLNFSDYIKKEIYKCEECGKEVIYDQQLIDELEPYQEKDITKEDIKNENPQVMEFIDMQIAQQTFGKCLCSNCLKKHLKENNLI